MTRLDDIRALEAQHIVPTYARQPVMFVRGDGVYLYDSEGRAYLDMLSGIGVAARGHADPDLTRAIAEQAATLMHVSNLYFHPLQAEAASRLAALSGLPRVFFCNSGAEAVEACLKFARRYWHTTGERERTGFVALEGGFSGRTMGALSVTHNEHYREPFEPLVPGVTFVNPRDPAAIAAAITDRTAAIIAEPIQGEGGVRPLPQASADAIRDACRSTGTLYIADEVQSGLGRTGYPFYFQALGLEPDLVSVGKALGGGVPIGATLVSERVAQAIAPGDHGTTYGGNLLACRAAIVVLEQLASGRLLEHIRAAGVHLERRLRTLALAHPAIVEIRGAGLMRGIELTIDAGPVVDLARERGLLVNRTDRTVVRMLPPLTVTEADLDRAVDILDEVLAAVAVEVTR
ncbi:MAG: aspartate aminotransferase family protein [Acidimicrobiia bacterium]|nr:aspartate aminotransferase family protein [Acidimicrobiia bacterium]